MIPFYVPPKLSDIQIMEITSKTAQTMRSGQITNGENTKQFEQAIKELHKVDHVIACSSCTQAMWIVLKTLKPSTVTMQSFTWQSLQYILPSEPVIFRDIFPDTWLIDTHNLPSDMLVYTHTFGNTGVAEDCANVVYDGAYSLGADLPDIGVATVISTTATKTVTSCEGGLILTNDNKLATEMTETRDKCSRMSELNAIVGLAYLPMLNQILEKKKKIFEYYRTHLPFKSQKTSRYGTNYGYYGCLVPNRTELLEHLKDKVDTRIRYEPLEKGFSTTDEIARQILVLPCYPDLNPAEVVNAIMPVIEVTT